MKTKNTVLIAATMIALASCTVEKRRYMSGYHVEWKGKKADRTEMRQPDAPLAHVETADAAVTPAPAEPEINSNAAPVFTPVTAERQTETGAKARAARPVQEEAVASRTELTSDRPSNAAMNELSRIREVKFTAAIESQSHADEILLIILAIFIPPLAVYLYEGSITTNFWIDLILTLIIWVPGVIYAFIVILS